MGGRLGHGPAVSGPQSQAALLWSQCHWSLLLWKRTSFAPRLHGHLACWAEQFCGVLCPAPGLLGSDCSIICLDHFNHTRDPVCPGQTESIWHLGFSFHCGFPGFWHLHLCIYQTVPEGLWAPQQNTLCSPQHCHAFFEPFHIQPKEWADERSLEKCFLQASGWENHKNPSGQQEVTPGKSSTGPLRSWFLLKDFVREYRAFTFLNAGLDWEIKSPFILLETNTTVNTMLDLWSACSTWGRWDGEFSRSKCRKRRKC